MDLEGRKELVDMGNCLPSTVYPPLPAPLFFSMKRGPAAVSLLPKTTFLQVHLLFSTWQFFFLSVKRHCLQGWCLGGVQGVLRRVWGAREDAQGVWSAAHAQLSNRKKKQRIVNDMGQLHYMLTESVIIIPCQICYRTAVGPLCEGTEESYNRMLAVWCISALVHAYVLFCIHIVCKMWQFSFWGWGSVEG